MRGQFSTKSDVFSFGILVIEIVTGRRNTGHYFYDEQNEDIISLVSTCQETHYMYNSICILLHYIVSQCEPMKLMLGMEALDRGNNCRDDR
jgi:serine/threonine protein kinase